jgi:quinoprotein relay system zinc metallohydrolase 2
MAVTYFSWLRCGFGTLYRRIRDVAGHLVCHIGVTMCCAAGLVHADVEHEGPLPVAEVAPGIFVHSGHQEVSTAHNHGDICNVGFVIGSRCVAVVDTGGSIIIGRRLRAAVKATTALPICYVINTHIHPDHIFGNAAFKEDKPAFVGHVNLAAAMAARGRNYRNALIRDVGADVAESEIIPPTQPVADRYEIDLGDRILKLRAWPTAHTNNDLTIYDEKTGTLWLSDLLMIGHTPVVDGSLTGWLKVIGDVAQEQPVRVVPGHGSAANWRLALAAEEGYLRILLNETRAAIKAKKTMQQAIDSVGWQEKDKWLLFEEFHRRNVTASYAELEWED